MASYLSNDTQLLKKDSSFSQQESTQNLSSATVLLHSSSELSNTKLRRLWDIIPSSSLNVKVMHFLSSGKGDTGLLLANLSKIGKPSQHASRHWNLSMGKYRRESPVLPNHSILTRIVFYYLPCIGRYILWNQGHILLYLHTPPRLDWNIGPSKSPGYESIPFGPPKSVCNPLLKITNNLWQQNWTGGREEV